MLLEGDLISLKMMRRRTSLGFQVFAGLESWFFLVEDMDIGVQKVEKSVTGAYKGKDVPSALRWM